MGPEVTLLLSAGGVGESAGYVGIRSALARRALIRPREAGLAEHDENYGTKSSNPLPSSRQSVSSGISPSGIEKPAVAAASAGLARRHGRQRRAGLVNIMPTAGNISVGPYSSTAVSAMRFATVVAVVRQARSG